MASADSQIVQELSQKHRELQSFRASLGRDLQISLDRCEWGLIFGEGQDGLPLITLRLPRRIHLRDPFLSSLAEQVEQVCGPVDFALFSGESSEPIKVLSQTLLDQRWPWH